jgi:hypothetical protein
MHFQRLLVTPIVWAFATVLTLTAAEKSNAPAFDFREVTYFHRWSNNEQHEFTPDKQEDLDHWTDMITVNGYPDVHDGDSLAATANAVLENYKRAGGKILKTSSIPRTADRPAEHFIAVMFTRPAFSEIAFARFELRDNKGQSSVYSHRFYGDKKNDEASSWIKVNGAAVEKALLEWSPSLGRLDKAEG